MSAAVLANYHTHTTWCDGRDAPEDVVRAALARGFAVLGFSSHADMIADIPAYIADIRALARRYEGRIRILCGLEAELSKPPVRGDFDYVIGSFHFLPGPGGKLYAIDHSPEKLFECLREAFGGDAQAFVRAYFAELRRHLSEDFSFVGHPDLLRKFNRSHPYFDETSDWYRRELVLTADAIAASGKPVEVNTGAISRGWLDDAYPSDEFRELLRARGVRFVLSSDAHAADAIDCAFDRYAAAEDYLHWPFGTSGGGDHA